jgi:hypothetical protein
MGNGIRASIGISRNGVRAVVRWARDGADVADVLSIAARHRDDLGSDRD